ncbi:MAG TPA: hypothetical protein VE196_06175, partial [Pseudonocardiaceae bacterium]|nr:hypothetical protein [Pseudonocardiaceae bacterium]
ERFAGDARDLDAAVLTGFLTHLGEVDLDRSGIVNRLRWAAYRAGLAAVREALDAPTPRAPAPCSAPPPPPCGHPDLVLARAVEDGAVSGPEAELIGSTRLGETTLAEAARRAGISYQALKRARARAELRLLAYLHHHATDTSDITGTSDMAGAVGDAPAAARPCASRGSAVRGNQPRALSPNTAKTGVRGRRNPLPPTGTPAAGSEARRCA